MFTLETYLPATPNDTYDDTAQYCEIRDMYTKAMDVRPAQLIRVRFSSSFIEAWRETPKPSDVRMRHCFNAVRSQLLGELQEVLHSNSAEVIAPLLYIMNFVVSIQSASTAHAIIAKYFYDRHINVRIYPT